jgi:hypothetical protein
MDKAVDKGHHAGRIREVLAIEGDSYRMKEAKEQASKRRRDKTSKNSKKEK